MVAFAADYNLETGDITVKGQTFNISQIPGNGWPQARLNLLRDYLLQITEYRVLQSSLPIEDPDRTSTDSELREKYNNRTFLDGDDLVIREVDFEPIWNGEKLVIISHGIF